MSDEIKILLSSDLHIGSDNPVPAAMRLKTFRKISSLAASHDIMIIAGDMFDSEEPDESSLKTVKDELDSLTGKGVNIVLNHGRHDSDYSGNLKGYISTLPFTKIITAENYTSPWTYTKGYNVLHIYGLPYYNEHNLNPSPRSSEPGFHLGLFYSGFEDGNDPKYSGHVLKRNDLRDLNLDFYALGSCHDFKMFKIGNRIIGAYPGSPEAVSFDETGDRFVISFKINGSELLQMKRLTVNSVNAAAVDLDCTVIASRDEVFNIIEKNRSKRTVMNLRLKGSRNFSISANDVLSYSSGFCRLVFEDESEPTLMHLLSGLSSEDSLRGEFFKVTRDALDSQPLMRTDKTVNDMLKLMISSDIKGVEGILCGSKDA